jgi:predicted metal-binding protein
MKLSYKERSAAMYRKEAIKNKTTMEEYMEGYKNAAGFLDYCEKNMGYQQVWSCPLYDFNPEDYGANYKYFYLIGSKITLDEEGVAACNKSGGYFEQICLEEKYILSKKVHTLEKKYPGSLGLITGDCHMCSQCTRPTKKGCRYSDEIRYFLESIGAGVGKTAGDYLGIKLKRMKEKQPECFTLIHGLLTDDPKVEI